MARVDTLTACPQASNLDGLASGAAKPLGVIDLQTANAQEFGFEIKATLAASGVSTAGTLDIYLLVSADNTIWTDNISPSSTADVSASIKNAQLLPPKLNANANSQVVQQTLDIYSLVGVGFRYAAIVVKNSSGAALLGTGNNSVSYLTVNFG